MPYSEKFKEQMVKRLLGPAAASARALSREVGVPQPTLSKWLRASLASVSKDVQEGSQRPVRERTPEEKAALVFEARGLSGEELGAFLRRNGLHEADLAELRRWLREQLDPRPSKRDAETARKARKADQKRIKQLERELKRKDKALAEAAALLVLQKKVRAIWGDGDDDTTGSNED
jgi:transposase